jgi:hypothetical protein
MGATARLEKSQALISRLWTSSALVALALFVAINAGLANYARVIKLNRLQLTPHGEGWWATKSLMEQSKPADVMLIGSSLVERLINEGEATYLGKTVNALEHRRCQHLEDRLSNLLGFPVRTSSYAVGGLHASDASVVASEMFKGELKPKLIVYGIAPRDIMNNYLASPYITETYQLMSKLGNLSSVAYQARMNTNEKFEYFVGGILSRVLFSYDYRSELGYGVRRAYKAQVNELANKFVPNPTNSFSRITQIELRMLPEEMPDKILIAPDDQRNRSLEDNRQNYLFSYRPFRKRFYDVQFAFLDRFLRITRDRGIQVVFVNMPLRHDNFEAMMPGFYRLYCRDLTSMAAKYGASVIDMNRTREFGDDDFSDQVHLNGRGASKLIDSVAPALSRIMDKQSLAETGSHI